MNKIFHIAFYCCIAIIISACTDGPIFEEKKEIAKPASCPKINIIADAHEIEAYLDDSNKEIINQIYKAKISYGNGECFGNVKEIKLVFPVIIEATRAPAMKPQQTINMNIVTAIAKRKDNILLQRRIMPIDIFFEENNLDVRYKEELTFIIPNYDYSQEIFLGFGSQK